MLLNLFKEEGFYTVDSLEFLNDSEYSWGVAYGVLVPVLATLDIIGTVVAAPVTLISVIGKGISNSKFNKLISAIKSGKKVKMDIGRVYKLRDVL